MKTIKTIFADGLKLDYHKTKKDFVVYLQTKRYPLKSNLGTKAPKIGMKFAALAEDGKVEFWERVKQDKNGNCWKKLGSFNYTEVEKTATHIICKKQNYLHRDILQDKKECELFFDDGTKQKVSGVVLVNCLFNDCPLPKVIEPEKTKFDLLKIADEKLNPEMLAEKMRLEMAVYGNDYCPF